MDKPSKAKDDKKENKKDEKEGGQTGKEGGGVETPKGEAGDEKPRGTQKEAKADKQPEPPRPNLITVPEADFTVKEKILIWERQLTTNNIMTLLSR